MTVNITDVRRRLDRVDGTPDGKYLFVVPLDGGQSAIGVCTEPKSYSQPARATMVTQEGDRVEVDCGILAERLDLKKVRAANRKNMRKR